MDNQICSTGFCVIKAKKKLAIAAYLFYVCRSSVVISQLTDKQSGAAYPAVRDTDIYNALIPIPYPNEPEKSLLMQRQLVYRLEGMLDEVRQMRADVAYMQEKLNLVMDSAFDLIFNYQTRNNFIKLSDVCDVVMGQSPPGESYNDKQLGTPLLNGPTEFGKVYPIPIQWTTSPTKLCKPGDLLVCVRGATTGRTNRANQVYCIGRGIAAIRPKQFQETKIDYIAYFISGETKRILSKGRGSTFPNISKQDLENWGLPNYNLQEQQITINYLDDVQADIDKMQTAIQDDEKTLRRAEQAILEYAFRGEL